MDDDHQAALSGGIIHADRKLAKNPIPAAEEDPLEHHL